VRRLRYNRVNIYFIPRVSFKIGEGAWGNVLWVIYLTPGASSSSKEKGKKEKEKQSPF